MTGYWGRRNEAWSRCVPELSSRAAISTALPVIACSLHFTDTEAKQKVLPGFAGAGMVMVQWPPLIIWRVLERMIARNPLILLLELFPSFKAMVYVDFLYCWWDKWEYNSRGVISCRENRLQVISFGPPYLMSGHGWSWMICHWVVTEWHRVKALHNQHDLYSF